MGNIWIDKGAKENTQNQSGSHLPKADLLLSQNQLVVLPASLVARCGHAGFLSMECEQK